MRTTTALLVSLGALVAAIFSSLTAYRVMMQLAHSFEPGHVIVMPSGHSIGIMGLLVFGAGVIGVAFRMGTPVLMTRVLCLVSSALFAISSLVIGYGTWLLGLAFYTLATATSVQQQPFLEGVSKAWVPFLVGWGGFVSAAVVLSLAMLSSGPVPTGASRSPLRLLARLITVAAFVFLLLSACWGVVSLDATQRILVSNESVEPTQLAQAVLGLIRSVYVSLIGTGAVGLMAFLLSAASGERVADIDD